MCRYIEYFLFLKSKNPSDYNGIEYFVSKCIEEKNISFLPGKNTRFLVSKYSSKSEDTEKDKVEKLLGNLVSSISGEILLTLPLDWRTEEDYIEGG